MFGKKEKKEKETKEKEDKFSYHSASYARLLPAMNPREDLPFVAGLRLYGYLIQQHGAASAGILLFLVPLGTSINVTYLFFCSLFFWGGVFFAIIYLGMYNLQCNKLVLLFSAVGEIPWLRRIWPDQPRNLAYTRNSRVAFWVAF